MILFDIQKPAQINSYNILNLSKEIGYMNIDLINFAKKHKHNKIAGIRHFYNHRRHFSFPITCLKTAIF